MNWSWNSLLWLYIIVAFVVISKNAYSRKVYGKDVGYTSPVGDIIIEYGDSLEMYCGLNADFVEKYGPNSTSRLSFWDGNDRIDMKMIEIINSTTIRLYIEKPPLMHRWHTCALDNDTGIDGSIVFVGTKPNDVTDFTCVSNNWDNLTCSWTAPDNMVYTKYNLTLNYGDGDIAVGGYDCPSIIKNGNNRLSCVWSLSTAPQYRNLPRTFFFQLAMTNVFGENSMSTVFNHYQNVLPAPPTELRVVNKTYKSIDLRWKMYYFLSDFPPGVKHRVLYRCQYGPKYWKLAAILHKQRINVDFHLTGLHHANALCQIKVALKSGAALENDASMWSANASITVRLGTTIPDAPPKTTPGSFEIISSDKTTIAYIYWQQIPKELQNGPKFHYNISVDGKPHIRPEEITFTYAKFNNLSTNESYQFKIWSENADGPSINASVVYIPEESNRTEKLSRLTKIDYGGGKYELNWKPPKHLSDVKSYTLFWCKEKRDRPYKCNGFLNWIRVPTTETSKEMYLDEENIYQFAISANSYNRSSAMQWAHCTILHSRHADGKIKNVQVKDVGSTYIDVGWKLLCSDQIGSVRAFIVYYCPMDSSSSEQNCKRPPNRATFYGDLSLTHGIIVGLKPSTTYMLTISVLSKKLKTSLKSDAFLVTTLKEEVPLDDNTTTELVQS